MTQSPSDIHRKSVRGVVAVMLRQVIGQGLNIGTMVFLARFLAPAEFGVYTVLQFFGSIVGALVGSGVAGALVRQTDEPTPDDLRTAFFLQLLASVCLGGLLLGASPWLIRVYSFSSPHSTSLLAVVALAYVVMAFQVVPQARLERALEFRRVAAVELVQIVAFNGCVLLAASLGTGGLSFGIGLLARALVGAVVFRRLVPRLVEQGRFSRESFSRIVDFGLPFQGANAVAVFKDSFVPIFVGSILGAQVTGYVNWASMVAVYPVLVLLIASRVYLPSFSRLQRNPDDLARLLRATLALSFLLVAPLAMGTLAFIGPITRIVFGSAWIPAVPVFYLLWIANLFVPFTTTWSALLNATGEARTPLLFTALCAAITWGIGIPLTIRYGALGYGIANVCVQVANLFLWLRVRRLLKPFHASDFLSPWGVASVLAFVCWVARLDERVADLGGLILAGGVFLVLYAISMAIIHGRATLRFLVRMRFYERSL